MPVHSFSAAMQPVRLAICRCFYLTGIYWRHRQVHALGNLDPQRLSKVAVDGEWLSGDKPSKEVLFHLALYRNNPRCKAVVHLHSTWSTALSCLQGLDSSNVIRPFTPYVVMRMGNVPLVPYYRPGDKRIAQDLAELAADNQAFYWQIMAQWFAVKACKKPPTIWKSWRKRQS